MGKFRSFVCRCWTFAGGNKIRHTPNKNVKTQLSYGVVTFMPGMEAIPYSSWGTNSSLTTAVPCNGSTCIPVWFWERCKWNRKQLTSLVWKGKVLYLAYFIVTSHFSPLGITVDFTEICEEFSQSCRASWYYQRLLFTNWCTIELF